jgi:hypothetical protein
MVSFRTIIRQVSRNLCSIFFPRSILYFSRTACAWNGFRQLLYYIILYKTLNNAAKHWARIIVHTIDILP